MTMGAGPYPFRFNALTHEYIDLSTGELLPHITGMLERTGWMDDTWFTEESSERGIAVHRLTAEYDLGALDATSVVSRYRPYLLAHEQAVKIVRPEFLGIEEPHVHPAYHYGGRPDRWGRVYSCQAVVEEKTGQPTRGHQIQTALQAILLYGVKKITVPPEHALRFCLYLKPNGKFKFEPHTDKRDIDEARRVIKACCGS